MKRLAALVFSLCAFVAPGAAMADPVEESAAERPYRMAQRSDFVPLEEIFATLRRDYSGHQLSVSGPAPQDGGYVYRIKWLTDDGAVLYVVADAETGDILSVEGE